jgi:hypothetical protein
MTLLFFVSHNSIPFNSDEDCLEYHFKLYEKRAQEEADRITLFAFGKNEKKKK